MMVLEMMSFRSRGLKLRPVNSVKHVVDIQGALAVDTQAVSTLIEAVDNPIVTNNTDVATASHVKAFFLNVQVAAQGTGGIPNVYMFVAKNPGKRIAVTDFPDGNKVGVSNLKKLVFHQEMIMTEENTTAIPRTLFRGVLKIPRHMQRFGQDDEIDIYLYAPGIVFDFCVQCIYKEFR